MSIGHHGTPLFVSSACHFGQGIDAFSLPAVFLFKMFAVRVQSSFSKPQWTFLSSRSLYSFPRALIFQSLYSTVYLNGRALS